MNKRLISSTALALLTMAMMPAVGAGLFSNRIPVVSAASIDANLQANINTLAAIIANDSNAAHGTGTIASAVKPVLTLLSGSQFDWNEVMFGTDSLSAAQTKTSQAITPDIRAIASLQVTTEAGAASLIEDTIAKMQALNPAIDGNDVVSFLDSVVSNAPLILPTLPQDNATELAKSLHGVFDNYLNGTSPAIQSIFSVSGSSGKPAGGTGTGAGAGAGGTPPPSDDKGSSTGSGSGSAASGGSTGGLTGTIHLRKNQRVISLNGKVMVVPALVKNKTTYMPIWYVMHALKSLGYQSSWNGNTWIIQPPNGVKPDLTKIQSGTGTIGIYIDKTLVQRVDGTAAVDPSTGNKTMYMPIWYVMQVLKRIGGQSTWNGQVWGVAGVSTKASGA